MAHEQETQNWTPAPEERLPKADLISNNGVRLLDTIDDLRRLGIDKDIPLPQIVVVGSQSAGKSSVLEAISGIAFPVNDGLCTTFASEIRLRRCREGSESIAMNVVSKVDGRPGEETLIPLQDSESESDAAGVAPAWNRMSDVIERASKAMGDIQGQRFCQDVLRIEVSGPDQDHLSLIDLPGIFHLLKPGQDPAAPQRVKDTVLSYMKEKRSIILAVVSARDDYANQEILTMVEEIDPSGTRTLGIITGPDLTPGGTSRENDYIALARNELVPLALGWHVVRNLSHEDRKDSQADRNALEEKFFCNERPVWLTIPDENRGAPQLKKKLSQTLLAHIGKELGGVMDALEAKIQMNEMLLKRLGPERSTTAERRVYLTQLGTRHQAICKDAVDGIYQHKFFALSGQRLRAKLAEEYDLLNAAMKTAHRWDFLTPDAPSLFTNGPGIGESLSIDSKDLPKKIPADVYLDTVDDVLQRYRGRELPGIFSPGLVGVLFRDQACRWPAVARCALDRIAKILHQFMECLVMHLVEERRGQVMLRHRFRPAMDRREVMVREKLDELLKAFHTAPPLTLNSRFRELSEDYSTALHEAMEDGGDSIYDLRDSEACKKLALAMLSYYDVARATFVDNVVSLAIELCLLDGFSDILSPLAVAGMTDEEIAQLTSDFPDDAIQRQRAQYALRSLPAGLELCKDHDRRTMQTSLMDATVTVSPAPALSVTPPATPAKNTGFLDVTPNRSASSRPSSPSPPTSRSSSVHTQGTKATTPSPQTSSKPIDGYGSYKDRPAGDMGSPTRRRKKSEGFGLSASEAQ